MTYTIFGNAGGVHLTLGAMTAKGALDRINTMRQCGAKLSSVQDGVRSFTEEELVEIAKIERGPKPKRSGPGSAQ